MQDAGGSILSSREDAIAFLTLNRPERHNALSDAMCDELLDALAGLAVDDTVRVLVLTGAGGRAFSAGADISRPAKPGEAPPPPNRSRALTRALAAFPRPTIAGIRGHCLGGGLGLALAADLRIATAGSQFGIPAAKLGVVYSREGLRSLVSVTGAANARLILYTGRSFNAADALRMGLVNQVVDDPELEPVVRALASEIAANAPLAVLGARTGIAELARDAADRDWSAFMTLETDAHESDDRREGRRAFTEKRRPEFRGR